MLIKMNTGEIANMSADGIRSLAPNFANGEYATEICKGCGTIYCDPNGNYLKAQVVEQCKGCFSPIIVE